MQKACVGSGYCCRLAIVSLRFDSFIILERDTYDSNPYDPVGRVGCGNHRRSHIHPPCARKEQVPRVAGVTVINKDVSAR